MLAETIALVLGRDKEARLASARARSRVRTNKLSDFGMDDAEAERFKSYFHEHLRPLITSFEEERVTQLARYKSRAQKAIIVAILLLITLLFMYLAQPKFLTDAFGLAIFLLGGLIFFLLNWASRPIRDFQSGVKFLIIPKLIEYFGEGFKFHSRPLWSLYELKPFDILPRFDESSTEDQVNGQYKDVTFKLMEAELKREERDSDGDRREKTVFKGFLVLFDFNKSFVGKTILKKSGGILSQWFQGSVSGMERVTLEDPEFERQFDVYSTNQIEARYLLTTSFMERMLSLTRVFGGKSISCSFHNKQLLLMISSNEDRFEPSSIFKPVTFEYETKMIVKELGEIFRIIDQLKLAESTGL